MITFEFLFPNKQSSLVVCQLCIYVSYTLAFLEENGFILSVTLADISTFLKTVRHLKFLYVLAERRTLRSSPEQVYMILKI